MKEGGKLIYDGRIVKLAVEEVLLPNGKRYSQETILHPGAACVVPFFDDGDLLLIKQYRHATRGWIWEIPAGKLDKIGEDPADCAKRELIEETGFRASRLEKVIEFFTAPGFCTELLHLYKATGLKEVGRHLEEHEVIEVHKLSPEKISEMLRAGEIRDAKTIIGLLACGIAVNVLSLSSGKSS